MYTGSNVHTKSENDLVSSVADSLIVRGGGARKGTKSPEIALQNSQRQYQPLFFCRFSKEKVPGFPHKRASAPSNKGGRDWSNYFVE